MILNTLFEKNTVIIKFISQALFPKILEVKQ